MSILDIILFVIIFAVVSSIIIVIRLLKVKKHFNVLLIIIAGVSLYSIICFINYNYLFVFTNPVRAFKFAYNGEVLNTVEGEESCFILFTDDKVTYSYMILPKHNDKYKISFLNTGQPAGLFMEDCFIDLCRYKHSRDFYVMVIQVSNNETDLHISDNYNSNFYKANYYNDSLNSAYIGFVKITSSEYKIKINNETSVYSNIS